MNKAAPAVVVTGGSRGIGKAICCSAAALGCSVVINYRTDAESAKQTAVICRRTAKSRSQDFPIAQADVGTEDGRASLVDQTIAKLGRIDALVNNAGVGPRTRTDITSMSIDSYSEVMRTNLEGPHFLTQKVVNYWLQKKPKPLLPGGFKVVFISSLSAYAASVDRGEYCISKAGISMAAKLWAARLANEGIQVFEVRPGIIETDMTHVVKDKYDRLISKGIVPQMRWGKPDDVASVVKSLLAGDFTFSTGEVIDVDGGFHIRTL